MADENIEILYFAPANTRRSSIPYYARAYVSALTEAKAEAEERLDVVPLLDESVPERVDNETAWIARTKAAIARGLRAHEGHERQILHAELGRRAIREFWSAHHASRLCPSLPLCVTFHDPPHLPPSVKTSSAPPEAGVLERLLTKVTTEVSQFGRQRLDELFLDRCAALLALSECSARILAQAYPRHAQKVIQLPAFNLGTIPSEIEPKMHRIGETIVVTCLDFVRSEEGILETLDALLLIHRRVPLGGKVRFRIRGAASDLAVERGVVDRIRDRIRSGGSLWLADFETKPMSENEVDALLRETDILVLPYAAGECEAASKTLMRSQTWAVATVAADTGCIRELIEDGKDGILYPPGDVRSLALALKKLIGDQDARMGLARALRQRALRERTPDRLRSRMAEVYGDLLAARAEGRPPSTAFRPSGEAEEDA
ncbi:glycosyltransferase family 4 protein [Candidatus Sumerlaeota bacterium]|nr:glycosyltransferase family 4 protein [Candidatus Sumerlaeota bacterium]